MTDRELLELAAKAVGMKIDAHYVDGGASVWTGGPHSSDWIPDWTPLTDDGDALRLAVKLKIVVDYSDTKRATWTYGEATESVIEPHSSDPYAATRRAIVRAAAEIGKAM